MTVVDISDVEAIQALMITYGFTAEFATEVVQTVRTYSDPEVNP